ncbi:MAG: tRNA (guanosine(37)-N1)-methyltransferase TrmD [Bacteroidales bacterium]|uniref:tRNA (guanosine(37)-N1)-methyltransferase TrmD n=1 Tax=Candidatus Cryptobacteroides sp. TaxID=2952915 RepID=UPI002A6D07F9|nr:tRNA (guanosine(37)-N1)-methyltransferase TrmD [Candidatus Cryptobacteroides sp.]MCI6526895.1 tRNA (guanosine(37)-N1)-methyltransferase TrmD [Bacteroidales bacterium]MDD6828361.1 tRNA (guanosine(37)-N1)-methyltransferase TrmD [Bacteroidales bacterium]MDD7234988.1 tRNA (guanosine(37)-N1)-methyltransferase TrmD [Bacteroidales bacterium]MDY2701411.1 tRNA (guanosine(37)-N1)-methyltransferase TrmD [Candidatus Cryptobacteroides sp.]
MRIDILTVVPELLDSPLSHSIVGRARKNGLVEIHVHNIRKYGLGPRLSVDDYSYGGDAGMVMMIEPVEKMIEELKAEREYDEVIYMSPDGEVLDQGISNELSLKENIIILCGHYKGIDHRIREHLITREISVGDYVVSGGEIPAALLTDSIVRLVPGVLSDETSALSDCFQDGLLSPPIYTRPADYKGWKVPEVLLSGNPKLIQAWQDEQALERTRKLRPHLLDRYDAAPENKK